MKTTNKQRVLDYLTSIAPDYVTNADIREATQVELHQQVYMLTRELAREGLIDAEKRGGVWYFQAKSEPIYRLSIDTYRQRQRATRVAEITPATFERLAGVVMSQHFGTGFRIDQVRDVPKRFDYVSPDGRIVGDAKYYTLVSGKRLPPAKFSAIAEHVWLLEKTGAPICFLVFGNDRCVPLRWLARYGHLVNSVRFYFLTDDGELTHLNKKN